MATSSEAEELNPPLRYVSNDQHVSSDQRLARPLQHFHDPDYIIAPVSGSRDGQMIQIKFNMFGIVFRVNHQLPAWTGAIETIV